MNYIWKVRLMNTEGSDLLEKTTEKIIDKGYDDTIKPVAKEVGEIFARPLKVINSMFKKLDLWLYERDMNFEEAKKEIARNIGNIAESEFVDAPKGYIFIPACQAISYVMDSDTLRSLYANLLSKAMVKSTEKLVHPAYIEMIKQMSPTDAELFKYLMEENDSNGILIIELYFTNGHVISTEEIGSFEVVNSTDFSFSVKNLERLGLVNIKRTDEEDGQLHKYNKVRDSSIYRKYLEDHKGEKYGIDLSKGEVKEIKKTIYFTPIGREFYKVCIGSIDDYLKGEQQ